MKLKYSVFFVLLMLGLSCSNDFNLIEGEVNIPIIYGLLDAQDTAHYIRVEKAFVDEEISATTLAMDPGNLYYDNAVVRLVKLESKGVEEVYTLTRVDGNLEGYVRDEGAFAGAPNYLYKIHNDLINVEEEATYRLEVEIPGEEVVTAETTVVEETIPIRPKEGSLIDFPLDRNGKFQWTKGNHSVLTSGILVFRYLEEIDGQFQEKSIEWRPFQNSDKTVYEFPGSEFYTLLANNIQVVPNAKRFFLGIDFTFYAGGQTIQDYLKVAQANLGITSSGEIPNFSNLSRGRGIFASRSHTVIRNIQLNSQSQEDLKTSSLTAALNFQ